MCRKEKRGAFDQQAPWRKHSEKKRKLNLMWKERRGRKEILLQRFGDIPTYRCLGEEKKVGIKLLGMTQTRRKKNGLWGENPGYKKEAKFGKEGE